ncbi:Tryptophan synthase beta chain [uncultured archaeon]|nr:Tryptophan synthase beta chain [uncultured archaeon]
MKNSEVTIWKTGGWPANILETVGNTPMVRINRLNGNPEVSLLAKLEGNNPAGSVKDRIALNMVEAAEVGGSLTKGKIILEPTSGNTGIAIAMIGAVKGYKVRIVMPESASEERKKTIRAFGAELVLTPAAQGTDGAINAARRMRAEEPERYFVPDQFSNPANPQAHYRKTAEEILAQSGGKVDAFVGAVGSGGTLMGVSRFLKERSPGTKVICAEPGVGHKLQGMKNMQESAVPEIFRRESVDGTVYVKDPDAIDMARQLAKKEGIFAGMSSGAAMWAAVEHAKGMERGTVVVLLPDRGDRYLSTGLFP